MYRIFCHHFRVGSYFFFAFSSPQFLITAHTVQIFNTTIPLNLSTFFSHHLSSFIIFYHHLRLFLGSLVPPTPVFGGKPNYFFPSDPQILFLLHFLTFTSIPIPTPTVSKFSFQHSWYYYSPILRRIPALMVILYPRSFRQIYSAIFAPFDPFSTNLTTTITVIHGQLCSSP